MNRPIKFRAWAKDTKVMHPVWHVVSDEDGVYELMQFTGLTDGTKWDELSKDEQLAWIRSGGTPSSWKGKEIYEGDVLMQKVGTEFGSLVELRGVMEWMAEDAQFGIKYEVDEIIHYHGTAEPPEVIGNVFENRELL